MTDKPPLTVENAGEYKKLFFEASSKPGAVIDLEGIPSIDVAGIQLIIATVREAIGKKREIHFSGKLENGFSSEIKAAGFTDTECDSGEDLENLMKAVFKI